MLAASRGAGLEAVTTDAPKVMLPIAGKPLLRWLVDAFKRQGVHDITVVGGYRADAIDTTAIKLVVNERHAETNELASLACAVGAFDEADTVISYGDLLFRSYILRDLIENEADFTVVVDSSAVQHAASSPNHSVRDYAYCSVSDERGLFGTKVHLRRIVDDESHEGRRPDGRWIGLLNVRGDGRARLRRMLTTLRARADFDSLDLPRLLNALVDAGETIEVRYIHGHWRGVNDLEDFRLASDFAHEQRPFPSGQSA